jgi:hypothetical protein
MGGFIMRFTSRLVPVLALLGLGVLPSAPAGASVLPQIEAALALQEATDGEFGAITKHYIEIAPGVRHAVRGARERNQVKFFLWVTGLSADRRAVYDELGYPTERYRERDGDRVTEYWRYESVHRTYVFEGDTLLRTERD